MRENGGMGGRRHLTPSEAAGALRRGSQIEQLLDGSASTDGRASVRWLSAYRLGQTFHLVAHHVADLGTEEFVDVTEFPPIDDDEYAGEGRSLTTADEAGVLLEAAVRHGADPERWMNFGMVQEEYSERREAR
jgi:hypothetical protein